MQKWNRFNYTPNLPLGANGERVTSCQKHIELSKNAAKEGMVLLKNDRQTLPLAKGAKVVLFGKGTFDYVKGGGGSGDTTVAYARNLYDGLKALGEDVVSVYEPVAEYYRSDVEAQYAQGRVPGMTIEPAVPDDLMAGATAFANCAIISICRFSGEGWDRFQTGVTLSSEDLLSFDAQSLERSQSIFKRSDFYLTEEEEAMVDAVKENFDQVIVVMNVGGMVDVSWFVDDDLIPAVLMAWQGGMEGGLAAAELLFGMGNPSGKLSDTFAKDLEDYPSSANFHESIHYVEYTEDIYVGYRYFETIPGAKDKVIYPFGYGLSYTQFNVDPIGGSIDEDEVKVQVNVTNVGNYAGKEVVQLYYSAPDGKLGKPAKELGAFGKTRLLEPGDTQVITLRFPVAQMASYDDLGKIEKSAYVLEQGVYTFYVGTSVEDVEAVFSYGLEEDVVIEKLSQRLTPTSLSKRMLSDGTYEELPMGEANDPNASGLERLPRKVWEGTTPSGHIPDCHCPWQPYSERGIVPFTEVAEGNISLDDFIAQLSVHQLADLLGGQPNTGAANTCGIGNLSDYAIPNTMTADGPAGLRIEPKVGVYTTAFPCATLLACSWNPDIIYEVGRAGAAEVKENNIGMWLTPAVNIHRSPLCGRNFEYYSEDPLLTGKLAAAMVRGITSMRISPSVKHFAFNNKETNRNNSDSRVSERAAREIYLKVFEIIVKESDPWCIMTSYNIINGHRTSECADLVTHILREEWGYQGLVTTDWWNPSEQYKEILAGNDVKMPTGFPYRIDEAVEKGLITREQLEISVKRVLELILKYD